MRQLCTVMIAAGLVLVGITGCSDSKPKVQRFGNVIGIKKEIIPEYNRLHAATWPEILKLIEDCNIHNYSIYLAEVEPDKFYLFSYFEYTGDDFEKDMEKMKAEPVMHKWWALTDPMQEPVSTRRKGEWWHVL